MLLGHLLVLFKGNLCVLLVFIFQLINDDDDDDVAIGNESVPIQLAQCRFPGLAISNAKASSFK